jgi:hypothetical protein
MPRTNSILRSRPISHSWPVFAGPNNWLGNVITFADNSDFQSVNADGEAIGSFETRGAAALAIADYARSCGVST